MSDFIPGKTPIRISGQTTGREEVDLAIEAVKTEWWTANKYTRRFERELGEFLGARHDVRFCNSGSSANLLAMKALTKYLPPKSPIVTTALAFPTTVAAILHAGFTPVFVDINLKDYNAQSDKVSDALDRYPTSGVFLAHTLGFPWDLGLLAAHPSILFVEDNCDALGATWHGQRTGTFGKASTCSFYPAHHITTGEGGAVVSADPQFIREVESFRDWGRDCWCLPGCDNTCGRRFEQQHGTLPLGYDHKYIYSNIGFNLKATDIQAAIGCAQLPKLNEFIIKRRDNWLQLRAGLADIPFFALPDPNSEASPFGFALTVRSDAPFTRNDLIRFLTARKIETRPLFAGNILRHPGFLTIPHEVVGTLQHTDLATGQSFWIGCYPSLTVSMLDYVIESFHDFVKGNPHE